MNYLGHETIPYLLQHKNNPADWYPWGPESLHKTAAEDKLIILSIGHKTCYLSEKTAQKALKLLK